MDQILIESMSRDMHIKQCDVMHNAVLQILDWLCFYSKNLIAIRYNFSFKLYIWAESLSNSFCEEFELCRMAYGD